MGQNARTSSEAGAGVGLCYSTKCPVLMPAEALKRRHPEAFTGTQRLPGLSQKHQGIVKRDRRL